jgi:hypothetical protein
LDKSKASFRRLQNSPAAQAVVIANRSGVYPEPVEGLRQDLLTKILSMAAQIDLFGVTNCKKCSIKQR